jgi:hypothetical protein
MSDKETISQIINQIKFVKYVIKNGYETAIEYGVGIEEEFTKTLQGKSKDQLLQLTEELKQKMAENSNRKPKQEGLKFCIGKCKSEFIPKDGMIQIYCSSCDRVKATRPIKNTNNYKDIE